MWVIHDREQSLCFDFQPPLSQLSFTESPDYSIDPVRTADRSCDAFREKASSLGSASSYKFREIRTWGEMFFSDTPEADIAIHLRPKDMGVPKTMALKCRMASRWTSASNIFLRAADAARDFEAAVRSLEASLQEPNTIQARDPGES